MFPLPKGGGPIEVPNARASPTSPVGFPLPKGGGPIEVHSSEYAAALAWLEFPLPKGGGPIEARPSLAPTGRASWFPLPKGGGPIEATSSPARMLDAGQLPENRDVCGDQLASRLARIGVTRHSQCREGDHPQ